MWPMIIKMYDTAVQYKEILKDLFPGIIFNSNYVGQWCINSRIDLQFLGTAQLKARKRFLRLMSRPD